MIIKTQAIILKSTRYSDKASIVTAYTRENGRISLIVYGLHSKRALNRRILLQPLSTTEIIAENKLSKDLATLKEIQPASFNNKIINYPVKTALALFIAELLDKSIRQSDTDYPLFDFIYESIELLNNTNQNIANFHLIFMVQLSNFLGFGPSPDYTERSCFDMLNGEFSNSIPPHPHVLLNEYCHAFHSLIETDFNSMENLSFTRTIRNQLLDSLIEYYSLHLSDFNGLKSTAVLREIFS